MISSSANRKDPDSRLTLFESVWRIDAYDTLLYPLERYISSYECHSYMVDSNLDKSPPDSAGRRRILRQVGMSGMIAGLGSLSLGTASGQTRQTEGENTSSDEDDPDTTGGDCEGAPTMSQTSITSPQTEITTESPAVVEANFRPDPTIPEGCTIIVDLEFSFNQAGFQWGGGADWDQSTSNLVVGTFEVRPGEIRDIRAELHTQGAEAGEQVTVVADYELWFEGTPEESVQQSGIRHTITVGEPNPYDGENQEDSDGFVIDVSTPGFGVPAALAGLGGGLYALKHRATGDSTTEE